MTDKPLIEKWKINYSNWEKYGKPIEQDLKKLFDKHEYEKELLQYVMRFIHSGHGKAIERLGQGKINCESCKLDAMAIIDEVKYKFRSRILGSSGVTKVAIITVKNIGDEK